MYRFLILCISLVSLAVQPLFAQQKIKYAPNPHFSPIDYVDGRREHRGIMAGYISLIQAHAGTSFHYSYYPAWDQILQALQTNEVDVVAGIHYSEERRAYAFFTERLFELPVFLITRQGYELPAGDLAGQKIAGVRGYASTAYIQKTFPKAEILLFASELEALMQTSSGQTHATVIDLASASSIIENYGVSNLQMGRMLDFKWDIRIAVNRNQPETFALIENALAKISPTQRDSIFKAHIGVFNIDSQPFLAKYHDQYIAAVWIIGLLVMWIIIFYSLLKQQIRKKTKELLLQTERYQWATRAASDAIFELDGESGIIHFEENFRELFGYELSKELNTLQHWWTYVHKDDLYEFQQSMKTALKERRLFMNHAFRFLKADGTYAQVALRAYLLADEKKRVNRVIGALQDVTKVNQHIKAISKQNERLREIAWMQSHIIRAPLARIMSLVMLLDFESPKEEKDLAKIHQLILSAARELDSVLQEIVKKSAEVKAESANTEI